MILFVDLENIKEKYYTYEIWCILNNKEYSFFSIKEFEKEILDKLLFF